MLSSFLRRCCLVACFALAVATAAPAQITTVPSGCPGGPTVLVPVGNFTIGTGTVVTIVPIGCSGSTTAMLVGTCLPTPVRLPASSACPPGPCVVSCNPFVTIVGSNPFVPLTINLPNDPTLVGQLNFCLQAVCIGSDPVGAACITAGDKLDVVAQ